MSATVAEPVRIRRGSEAHKSLFCRTLLDTFNPYKPAIIDWPALDADSRDRLVSLPIWDIAVQTEGRARLNVASYAAVTRDALLREAIELNAFEEGRHKIVLANMVAAYGIERGPIDDRGLVGVVSIEQRATEERLVGLAPLLDRRQRVYDGRAHAP